MKIRGREISGPNRVTLVLPREDAEDIPIVAQAILDMDEMDKYLVQPKAPAVQKPGGIVEYNFRDRGYIDQLAQYNIKKMAWIILKSLEPSEIDWDTVDMENPGTWLNYQKELREAGFSEIEVNRICNICMQANALDEAKLEAARQSFLHGQAEAEKSTSGPSTPTETS
jgi:hypothetical protein